MKTRFTELFGIEHPIMCGGMMKLCYPELCAAISNAGSLGNLTAAMYTDRNSFSNAVREVKALTDNPFVVNVTMLPATIVGPEQYRQYFDVIAEEKVCAVEIGGVPLDRFEAGVYLKKLKDAGVKLIHKVGTVKNAVHVAQAGYDAVIAAGVEEGGHPHQDNVATTVLTPRIREEVDIPVITAGGMADGRGLAAALCLGADGIMMASRFICTVECMAHENVKNVLIEKQENDTVLYGATTGLQGRALLNDSIKSVLEIEMKGGSFEDIYPHIAGTLGAEIWEKGNTNMGSINVGQSIGLIHDIVTCRELVDGIMDRAKSILENTTRIFSGNGKG